MILYIPFFIYCIKAVPIVFECIFLYITKVLLSNKSYFKKKVTKATQIQIEITNGDA